MSIASKEVAENTKLASGYRIKLSYSFSDGTVVDIKCRGKSEGDAQLFLLSKEAQVIKNKKQKDINYAVLNNITDAYGDASQLDVWREYIMLGYSSFNPSESMFYMAKVAQQVLELGYTNEQMASIFDSSIEEVEAIIKKWEVLKLNIVAVDGYNALRKDM